MIIVQHVERIDAAIESLQLSYKCYKTEEDFIHQCRLQIEHILFHSLYELYGTTLRNFWNTATIPLKSDKALIFVERRCHPNLEFCLYNAAYFARGYSIHIFCSQANHNFIKSVCGTQFSNIHVHIIFETIGTPEQGKLDYNKLLKTKEFWNTFQEEHIITMETDAYFLKHIPDSIYEYDYVASKWPWAPNEAGGGGLSYRKCSIMKKICDLEDNDVINDPMQDGFASNGIRVLRGKITEFPYFTECEFSKNSIGTHQWWSFISSEDDDIIKELIEYYLSLDCLNSK